MTQIEKEIEEIVEQTIRLAQSHAIWWEIMNPQSATQFDSARREHLDFFEPVAHSFLQGLFIISYQLCDHRGDSKHIRSLIAEVSKRDAALGQQLNDEIDKFAIAGKFALIRHKVFAHRDKNRTPHETLKASPIVVKEIAEMVHFIQDFVSTVAEAAGGEKKAKVLAKISECECSARNAAFQVLGSLSRELRRDADPDAKYWEPESESSQAIP
jgi:hypothetical protein